MNPAHFFRVGGKDENPPQGDSPTWIVIPIYEDAWSNFLHAYQMLERTWLGHAMARIDKMRSGKPAARDCEFQGRKVCYRLERRITISQVVRTCPKPFSFMIIFITLILVAPSRVHASNPRFKYDKIQRYCRNGPWMCYIIYYETKYAKNEEDFLPTSILEIWETLVAPSRFVSVENAWIISSGICKAGKAIMMTRAYAKCCCNVHGSILPEMWENQRFWLWWDCSQ